MENIEGISTIVIVLIGVWIFINSASLGWNLKDLIKGEYQACIISAINITGICGGLLYYMHCIMFDIVLAY